MQLRLATRVPSGSGEEWQAWAVRLSSDMEPRDGWPSGLWRVPYTPSAVPGAAMPSSWLDGSNCQRFAYGVLGLFGQQVPPLRSSELLADQSAWLTIDDPLPLDLVLYSHGGEAFGAHVGVWFDNDSILHLCAEAGRPAVWSASDFVARARYAHVVGFKRARACPASGCSSVATPGSR